MDANNGFGTQYPPQNNPYMQYPQYGWQQPQPPVRQQPVYTPQLQQLNVIPPKVVAMVQGDLEASIFRVEPNQEVYLIDPNDSNNIVLYTRRREANGTLSPLQKFKVIPMEETTQAPIDMNQFVKADDILDLINETVEKAVEKKLSEISFKPASEGGKSK